jgi:hypothetical protein
LLCLKSTTLFSVLNLSTKTFKRTQLPTLLPYSGYKLKTPARGYWFEFMPNKVIRLLSDFQVNCFSTKVFL